MRLLFVSLLSIPASIVLAQPCATSNSLGSASNMFTNIVNGTSPVVADKELNTVLFLHRNNASAFGGSSGQLRYDLSTDGGATWSNNLGVVNPLVTLQARYPQAVIYNPSGNTTATNAWLGYLAPTVNGTLYQGYVNGVRKLDGTGNTENYSQLPTTQTNIPHSMVKGAPGIFWSVDAVNPGTGFSGFRIFKGTWNGSSDISWAVNTTLTPAFNTAYNGIAQVGDYNIAFDPSGQYGWVSVLTHLTPGPSAYAFYPVFWYTTDGGQSWSGPTQVDLGQFSCISALIAPGNTATANFESDLAVDVNGEPHLLTTICNGNNAYAVFYSSPHSMFDITRSNGLWNAVSVASVNGGRGTWGTSPNTVNMDQAPQIARSADGTKLFFGWSDNSSYATGANNSAPNLFIRGFDAGARKWTSIRDVTSCQPGISGQAIFPKLAEECLEPVAGQYKIAAVTGIFTSNDPILIANFRFLDNLVFTAADFTVAQPQAAVAIDQGSSYIMCASAAATLSVSGAYDALLWSNGISNDSTSVTTAGNYYITARSGCTIGRDTITVDQLLADTAGVTQVCLGNATTLSVSGNALSYTWNPGNISGTSVSVTPAVTTTYTLTATGTGGCSDLTVVTVSVDTARVTVQPTAVICAGDSVSISAGGVNTYNWLASGDTTATVMLSPAATTTYIVNGVSSTGCTSSDSVTVTVNPVPVINLTPTALSLCASDAAVACPLPDLVGGVYSGTGVSGSQFDPQVSGTGTFTITYTYTDGGTGCTGTATAPAAVHALPVLLVSGPVSMICQGNSDTLTVSGAVSYNWMPGNDSTAILVVATLLSTTYTVTGIDSNGCSASDTTLVVVNPLPVVDASTPDSVICAGDMTLLTATGAIGYLWNPGNAPVAQLSVFPSVTTTYTVSGTDGSGCMNTDSVTIMVNPLPVVSFNVPVSFCVNDGPYSLNGGAPAGGSYFGTGVSGTVFSPATAGTGIFQVGYTYVNSNGCTDTAYATYTVNACAGMAENSGLEAIRLFPNPNNGSFSISAPLLSEETSLEITDISGRLIYREILPATGSAFSRDIDLGSAAAGIYYVKISYPGAVRVEKLVIR